jgi:hypothetical protein
MIAVMIFIAFTCNSCSAQDKLLTIAWDQYDTIEEAENIEYFVVYKWAGDTSAVFHVDSLVLVDTVQQMPTVQALERTAWFPMDKWIRAACTAHDSLNRQSPYAFSRFYAPPEEVERVLISDD